MIDYNLSKKINKKDSSPKPLTRSKRKTKLFGAWKSQALSIILISVLLSSFFGFIAGAISGSVFYLDLQEYFGQLNVDLPFSETTNETEYPPQTTQEQTIINVVKENSPAVVSVIVTKDLVVLEQYYSDPFEDFGGSPLRIPQYREKGVEKQTIGQGSGFIVSSDGIIVTNKHVVLDEEADYTVVTNNGQQYPAQVLAKDPIQDLAVLKVEGSSSFPTIKLGDSDSLQIGQTVIAIGNALGEFQNTVSVGVISGLGRTITASGGGILETLEDVIQTDAAINKGNSGGPLLNLKGEVVGINTAVSLEGENIGFTIPINKAKKDIEQVKTIGKIVYPFIGVRYIIINEEIQKENDLPVDYGALIVSGEGADTVAIVPGSPAEESGLQEGDIILEFDGQRITSTNSLADIISNYDPGDIVVLKVLRDEQEMFFTITLTERGE